MSLKSVFWSIYNIGITDYVRMWYRPSKFVVHLVLKVCDVAKYDFASSEWVRSESPLPQ